MSDADEDEDVFVKAGTIIETSKAKYEVLKMLGEGGFGAVYRVQDQADKTKFYAMKVEKKLETRRHSKLKMEIAILKLVSNERKDSHFTRIIDRGKKEHFFFLVMELVGKSLADLKNARPEKVLSMCTGFGVSMQCLEACQDLHKYGFIHRDLKPANYACGLENRHLIYILDFGIARRITNDKNELKAPRAQVKFKGTVRFASLSCHKGLELGPKDDCESWFYLLLDLIHPQGLPWRRLTEKKDVFRMKEECRKEKRDILLPTVKCKDDLGKMLDYFDSLKYHDHVDYEFCFAILRESAVQCGGNLNDPYDWEKEKDKE